MPPFYFALDPLLDRHRRVEDEKRQRCARRRRERDDALRARDRLVSALAARAASRSDARSLAVLDARIAVQRRRLAEAESALGNAADELMTASRERRVIEKLRERRRREYEREEARRDELEIDEANALRRAR
ncbi:MAG: flagellar FliJ family protein [Candidatus Eremiobacteraeota bacterium]|nr:flagellar FliJ family protein [Candidatus Eremiobacteraeota bacterium]MBV8499660.1 flagellar FliJ family protein [Candidatus Eremiobacteraeota bacterium]